MPTSPHQCPNCPAGSNCETGDYSFDDFEEIRDEQKARLATGGVVRGPIHLPTSGCVIDAHPAHPEDPVTTTHPAGPHTVANLLTERIRARFGPGWAEETDETCWRAQDYSDDCLPERWVIVATGQIAPRDAIGGRPGPLVVASGGGVEMRFQLPFVVGQDQVIAVVETLTDFGAIPAEGEATS